MNDHTIVPEYSQGVCGDGAVILCDGAPMTVDEVVGRLVLLDEESRKYRAALEWLSKWGDWHPEDPLPDGWPMHDGKQKTPMSPLEIVHSALSDYGSTTPNPHQI
ncbi:MAG: hypothetical protein ABTR07_18650 [Candidatus Competibacter denitrificans]